MRAEQLMQGGDAAPIVRTGDVIREVIYEISRKKLGMSCVVDDARRLVGIITDGDLRRHMMGGTTLLERRAEDVMTRNPITIAPDTLAVEALRILEERKITAVVVVDTQNTPLGVVHLHDLWRTGMI
jgi:arabinose-5-phosphate isomerase